jgi:hypothetical protein
LINFTFIAFIAFIGFYKTRVDNLIKRLQKKATGNKATLGIEIRQRNLADVICFYKPRTTITKPI